jgi:uncharacterized membrane protein YtjA (UPF0391 family)
MLPWAVVILIIGLTGGILGLSGTSGVATNIAWILSAVSLMVALIIFLTGRGPRIP